MVASGNDQALAIRDHVLRLLRRDGTLEVQRDTVRKGNSRELVDLQNVVQKLNKVIRMLRYVLTLGSRFRGNEFVSDMVRAATRRNNDVFEPRKKLYEMFFRRAAVSLAS